MKRLLQPFCAFCLACGLTFAGSNKHALILVTSSNSTLPALTPQETRKLFLGVPLEKSGERPVPLLNASDPLAYEVFLQKILFMSASAYESQTISVVFRLGGKRPETYADINALIAALQQTPGSVTYLWEDQANLAGIKPVGVLWQDSQN